MTTLTSGVMEEELKSVTSSFNCTTCLILYKIKSVGNTFLSSAALPYADTNRLSEHKVPTDEVSCEKSVELLFSGMGCSRYFNIRSHEDVEEKSIEPPPYSPLTPRPLSNHNVIMHEKQSTNPSPNIDQYIKPSEPHVTLHETIAEKRITPVSRPISPRSNQTTLPDPPSSPVRSMSPETANIFNILTEDFENDCGASENMFNINENNPIVSPASSNRTEVIFDDDDSVQDPDFVGESYTGGSDNSSGVSESLITSIPDLFYELNTDETETQTSSRSNQILQENISEATRSPSSRPKRGRKRKYGDHTREERKKRKYQNLSYVNSRKQRIEPKPFLDYNCNCPKKCQEKISRENRLSEFKKFYALGTYAAQNMFIAACVKENPIKRSYVSASSNNSKKKTFTRIYHLNHVLVCKKMFLNTLQTTSKRVNTSLCKKRDDCITDKRGSQGGHNKATYESEEFIINVIRKLPTYVSHYRRADCSDAKFLRSDMTLPTIYKLYEDEAKLAGQKVLSFSKVKRVFLTKFNLRTKPLKKDTCNKCDYFSSKKLKGSEEEKAMLDSAHREHLQKAKALQQQLKNDMQLAKEDRFTETITFDLQKTLPLPRIPTNIVFYKRQLWVYNLGIHSGSDDQAHCNVWVEGEAGRGSQEVGSCLYKHIMDRLGDSGVKNLILWSDSCGGQNRNIKLTLMLKALLNDHPTLETIRLRFLESGHSFLPNDTDFGRIECALKLQQRLYTPEDYMQIMQVCKKNKPMQVQRMKTEDFLSSANLEKKITNRKKATDGSKVSWLNTKEIMLKKEDEFSIFMRSNLDDEPIEVNIKKNLRGNTGLLTKQVMDPLWPNGKPIPEAKLNDLISLLHLIPDDAQEYYKKLTGNSTVQDDIDGFSGTVDFEVEVVEDAA